jgi:hypothetical protein
MRKAELARRRGATGQVGLRRQELLERASIYPGGIMTPGGMPDSILAVVFLLAAGWGTSFFGRNSIREYILGIVYFPAWGTVAFGGTLLFVTALTSSIFGPRVREDRDSLDTAIVLGFIGVLVLLFPVLGDLLAGEYAGKTLAEIFARMAGDIARTEHIRAKEFGEGFLALPEGWENCRWHVFAAVIPLAAFAIAKWKWRIACWLVLFPLVVLWPQL